MADEPGAAGTCLAGSTRADEEAEARLLRAEIRSDLRGIAPMLLIFCGLWATPIFSHMRGCILGTMSLLIVMLSHSALGLADCTCPSLKRHMLHSDIIHHSARLIGNLMWMHYHPDDQLARLGAIFVAPVDAVRKSSRPAFNPYLVGHVLLLLVRFRNDLFGAGFPYVVVGLVHSHMLLEIATLRQHSQRTDMRLQHMVRHSVDVAFASVQSVISCFCDATAVLTADLKFAESSTTLRTLLGRAALQGKAFEDLIHLGDRDEYRRLVASVVEDASREHAAGAHVAAGSDAPEPVADTKMRVKSTRLHLEDSFSSLVAVQVFLAYFEDLQGTPMFVAGLSEAWRPPRSCPKSASRSQRRAGATVRHRVNMESGRVEATSPLYPGDLEPVLAALAGQDQAPPDDGAPARGRLARGRPGAGASGASPRADSPRPLGL